MRKTNPELKKITKGVLIATLASVLTTSFLNEEGQAGSLAMQNFVNQMFVASSGGTATSSGNGVTYSGGYFEVRTPLAGANVIAFTPPDISAGCGGINLYFGSFHFINGQQFMALLREIGQQALGYAFQLAIDAMCHQCGALLAMIEKDIQDMNNALKNTCQLAKGVFNGDDMGDIAQVVNQTRKVMGSAVGDVSGIFSGTEPSMQSTVDNDEASIKTNFTELMNSVGDSGTAVTTTTTVAASQAEAVPQFNMFWKAINATESQMLMAGLSTAVTIPASVPEAQATSSNIPCENSSTPDACTKEILMSLVGTIIIPPQESSNNNNAQGQAIQSQTDNVASGNIGGRAHWYPASLNLTDLVNGTTNGSVYQCQAFTSSSGQSYGQYSPNTGCIGTMTTTSLSTMGYIGIKKTVQDLMFGGDLNGVMHNGLIPDLEQDVTPSATALAFENGLPTGAQVLLKDAQTGNQNNPSSLLFFVGKSLEPIVVNEFATRFGEVVLKAAQPYANVKHIILPPDYKLHLQTLENEEMSYQKLEAVDMRKMNNTRLIVQSARVRLGMAEWKGA